MKKFEQWTLNTFTFWYVHRLNISVEQVSVYHLSVELNIPCIEIHIHHRNSLKRCGFVPHTNEMKMSGMRRSRRWRKKTQKETIKERNKSFSVSYCIKHEFNQMNFNGLTLTHLNGILLFCWVDSSTTINIIFS